MAKLLNILNAAGEVVGQLYVSDDAQVLDQQPAPGHTYEDVTPSHLAPPPSPAP